ncbi:MAG TPA: ribokinase [Acidimicrobiales bacterium]|nr:ribokinase [Acidimicrobiales bacterium]
MAVRVACFGSLNHDITVWVPRPPAPDETLRAHRMAEFVGGKGANQAVAAARLGAEVTMIGRIGTDAAAAKVLGALTDDGVDVTRVIATEGPTGTAIPIVTDDGQVAIIIVAGANGAIGPADADAAADVIAASDVLLLQGEVNALASARAAAIAHDAGRLVVFNPAPVPDGWHRVLEHTSIVVANAQEALELGLEPPPEGVELVVTLGANGAQVGPDRVSARPAEVVDPTGAGDAFVAAFAVARAEGRRTLDAVRFAVAAGACAVEVAGAQPSMPHRAAVEARVAR